VLPILGIKIFEQMSINGIRRIKDTKQQNDPEQPRFQKLSEFTDSVYISTYDGVSSTLGTHAIT
jgi:hypothetical protein